ncbi:MAG: hypothetical protein ABS35_27105 [Kaistia sp. SCN 65-12]|nr:MAG: hypothetical protein ABS35_27105 [Kaistia sp. SCN 65-12]
MGAVIDLLGHYGGFWVAGAATTLVLSAASFPLSIGLGLIIAFASTSQDGFKALLARFYIGLFRGLPEILVIFAAYYGLNILVRNVAGWTGIPIPAVPPLAAVVIALVLQFASYSAVVFRDWLATLPRGLIEAGMAIGMSDQKVRARILIPLTLRQATPALGNLFLLMLKVSALASLVGVVELSRATTIISGSTQEPLMAFTVAAGLYLVISAISGVVQTRIEKLIARSH